MGIAGTHQDAARPFLFVGERQSPLAARRGWTWSDGRVCARTLHEALDAAAISPEQRLFTNLWESPGLGPTAEEPCLEAVQAAVVSGAIVVALGTRVARVLKEHGIAHRKLTHPAARGRIRGRDVYQAHVLEVLRGG